MGRLCDSGIRARIRLMMCIPLDLPLDHDGRFDFMDRPANAQICMFRVLRYSMGIISIHSPD